MCTIVNSIIVFYAIQMLSIQIYESLLCFSIFYVLESTSTKLKYPA